MWFNIVLSPTLLQDGLSEDQWKEAEEAAASAQVKELHLAFDHNSRQGSRAVQTIWKGLAKNKHINNIFLRGLGIAEWELSL